MQNHGGNELRQWKKVKNRDQQSSPGIINIHDEPFFPDDIIIEIVSLLPAKDALRFRSVCKKFRDLIDLPYINRSVPMSVPMILVSNNYYYDHQQFLLDKCWEPESEYHKKSKIRSSDYPVQFSHDGLIVSYEPESPADVIIFNPIYSKNVKIFVPSENEILGVFYNHSVREYCTLWETTVSNSKPVKVQYKMLILGSPPYWREMKDPLWTQNKRMPEIRPVLVNECLYWFVEREPRYKISNDPLTYKVDIMVMEFDTRTEGFKVIPCPIPTAIQDYSFFEGHVFNINLLNVNGLLLLVQISDKQSHLEITIWTLEDRVKKTWTSSEYSIKKEIRHRSMSSKAVAFWNGELVIPYSSSKNKGLLVCNLKLGTTRILWSTCRERDTPRCFVSHMMSFASLKNCKSIIFMLKRLRRMITE